MTWIIWNFSTRKWVAPPGGKHSFTTDVTKAQRFDTEAQAKANCCGDESPRNLQRELGI